MVQINKDNYKDPIAVEDRINIITELKEYFNRDDSEGYAEAALFIFNKYYDVTDIPTDFYLEAMYWISVGIGYASMNEKGSK